ncbi:MAG TPA: adenylyltransferase/cytidyltransferase family protein [Candidatus Paceibacterota bacterium]|nr:adenylyltransferase/cytidyltransferase family protein [Candidatus Paceibacterota bacterium]
MENENVRLTYTKTTLDPNEVSILKIVGTDPSPEHRIILDRKKLIWIIGVLKKEGLRIVYTGGVFDQMHDGHVKYLAEAKLRGDILIVGVDDDDLTRQRKPDQPHRPIDPLGVRLTNLVHIRSVNILTVRTTAEPLEQLIFDLLPDVAVFSKGTKDAQEQEIRSQRGPYCGEIVFLEPQSGNSTTAKISKVMINGAHDLAVHLKKELDGKVDLSLLEKSVGSYFTKIQGGIK